MMMRLITVLALSVLVAGCGQNRMNYYKFDGIHFPAKVKSQRKNKNDFTVRVRNADRSLEGARQAAHFEGTKYCVSTFGNSNIAWGTDPLTADIVLDGKDLEIAGTCLE